MKYSVHELAKMSGVSVRTLHYYDEIGLLKAERNKENGYREYGDAEILRLQQILFFRELDFSLERIKVVLDSPEYEPITALEKQCELLVMKRDHVDRLIGTIRKTISSMKGGESMSHDDTFSAFNDPTYVKHKDEAEKRWGHTDAYKQSMERVASMSQQDLENIKKESDEISEKLAELMKKGALVESAEVQEQIKRHYAQMCKFYDPSYEMYTGLGQMYVQDPRFAINYERVASGLSIYIRDAMVYFADTNLTQSV